MPKNMKNDGCQESQNVPNSDGPASEPDASRGSVAVELLKYTVKILITAGIVAALVWTSKKHGTFDGFDVSGLNWGWLAAAFALYILHLFVNAWRWRLLLA